MRIVRLTLLLLLLPVVALAQATARPSDAILDAIQLDELLQIMSAEARASGEEMAEGLLAGRGGEGWAQNVARINAPERLGPRLRDSFAEAMPQSEVAPVLDFLGGPTGRKFVGLELSARRALLDPAIEEMSRERLAERNDDDARLAQVERFVEVNHLVDGNVAGALNANTAFLTGLQAGAGAAMPGGQGAILDQVWEQEPEIRRETEAWVHSFLLMAYEPASDAELDAYIAFSETEAGQALNTALFAAFDALFVATSRATGEAAAQILSSEDI